MSFKPTAAPIAHLQSLAIGACAAVLLLALALPSARGATNLGNIMPLGDSITYGSFVVGGYRDPLYQKLTAAGYSFNYVGSATDNATTLMTTAGQTHHEGHSGYVIQKKDPTDLTGDSGRSGIEDNINTWIGPGGADPNYILLMIGTNDVDIQYYLATAGSRLSNLISTISNQSTGLRPNAHLIVARITPTTDATENLRVQTYNSAVDSVVLQHQAMGENVTEVDMYSALIPVAGSGGDMTDKLHPNASGYNKMADVWLTGIQAVPEPGSASLLGIGAVTMLLRRRRPRSAR